MEDNFGINQVLILLGALQSSNSISTIEYISLQNSLAFQDSLDVEMFFQFLIQVIDQATSLNYLDIRSDASALQDYRLEVTYATEDGDMGYIELIDIRNGEVI